MGMTERAAVERGVSGYLERIEAREQEIHAWAWIDPDQVLAQARKLDADGTRGPLHGVPIGVKDIIATADQPTEYGSPIYAGYRPPWDAACVAAARAAGAIVMGKTATTEFAGSKPGKTANPCNIAHTPGGSSSGSAAAVADGMVPLAIGSQTGGSVIRPASYCGIVGYKPSFGLLNRHGVKPLADSLDTLGVFANNIRDAALLVGTISRRDDLAHPGNGCAPRIGIWRAANWSQAASESVLAVESAAQLFSAAGASVVDVQVRGELEVMNNLHRTIDLFESSQALSFEMFAHRDRLSEQMVARIEEGNRIKAADYERALQRTDGCLHELHDIFRAYDVLVAPSAVGEAPLGLGSTGDGVFNRAWTLMHLPCISLPGFRGPKRLPIGVQLVGAPRGDRTLLAIGLWAEAIIARKV